MQSLKDFLLWYNNKDAVPRLEAMLKVVGFYLNKWFGMFKLGNILPNLANICLYSSTRATFHPFTESDKVLLSKVLEVMVGGPSLLFPLENFVDKTHVRKTHVRKTHLRKTHVRKTQVRKTHVRKTHVRKTHVTFVWKSIVGLVVSSLYPYSLCQPMPTRLSTRGKIVVEEWADPTGGAWRPLVLR